MNRERAQKTGLTLNIEPTTSLNHYLSDLALHSGTQDRLSVMAEAIALTAFALKKFDEGYVIQIIEQSIGHDKFSYPILPHHLYMEMKQDRNSKAQHGISVTFPEQTKNELLNLCQALGIDRLQDGLHFSLYFAHRVATQLHSASGLARLAYVDREDRRFGQMIKTPYDRTLRSDFNRVWQNLHHWAQHWSSGSKGPGYPPEPQP